MERRRTKFAHPLIKKYYGDKLTDTCRNCAKICSITSLSLLLSRCTGPGLCLGSGPLMCGRQFTSGPTCSCVLVPTDLPSYYLFSFSGTHTRININYYYYFVIILATAAVVSLYLLMVIIHVRYEYHDEISEKVMYLH